MKWCTHGPINTMKNWWSPIFMKIGQNDLKNLYFLLIIKTYHFFIQFSFKIGFLCFVPSGNVQKKCTLHVPFSFMLNEKEGVREDWQYGEYQCFHWQNFIYALSIYPDKIFFVPDKFRFVLDKIILSMTKYFLSMAKLLSTA